MKVRIARADDLSRLLTLRCALWPSVELQLHEVLLRRRLDNAARCVTMVLEDDDGLVCGFAELTREMSLAIEAARVQLEAVFVTPPMRRKGGANQLLDAAQRWAHGRGATSLFCDLPFDDEQARKMLRLLDFNDSEHRVRATRAVNVPMEVEAPRATQVLQGPDGDALTSALSGEHDGELEFVQMEKVRSPIAIIVNLVLFVCALVAFANTNIYSNDAFFGMVLPLLDVAFVLYFSFLFVAMRYRKRADSRARAEQLFNEPSGSRRK